MIPDGDHTFPETGFEEGGQLSLLTLIHCLIRVSAGHAWVAGITYHTEHTAFCAPCPISNTHDFQILFIRLEQHL